MWNTIKKYSQTIFVIIGLIFFGVIGFLFKKNNYVEDTIIKLKKRKNEIKKLSEDIDDFIDDSKSKGL